MNSYIPISCEFYDELEAISTLRKIVEIEFLTESGVNNNILGKIVNLYNSDKVEYMVLESGLEIRLDRLISVDGKRLSDYDSCDL